MTIFELLVQRIPAVATVGPNDDLQFAADRLMNYGIGALVVMEEGCRLAGILTESHIVNAMKTYRQQFPRLTVSAVMNPEVHTCHPDQSALELIKQMTEQNVRQMAVVLGERVIGLVSLDELVKERVAFIEQFHKNVAETSNAAERAFHLIEHHESNKRIFDIYRAWNDVQYEFGITGLDERSKQLLLAIGEAESAGSPMRLRDLMKQYRWGSYPTIRRSMGELLEAGLIEYALDPDGRGRRYKPSERGHKFFERLAESTLVTTGPATQVA